MPAQRFPGQLILDRLAKIDCTVNGWPRWGAGVRQPVGGAALDDVAGERQPIVGLRRAAAVVKLAQLRREQRLWAGPL